MGEFRLAEMAQLARELAMSPTRHRLRHLDGAERLAGMIDPSREYPLSFVTFHLTGFRPRVANDALLDGAALLADVAVLLDDLSSRSPLAIDSINEPLHAADELARRFRVSVRTIARWKSRGLVGRWYLAADGRKRFLISGASLARFVARSGELIQRAASFQVMNAAEKTRILARARALLNEQPRSMHAVSKIIAAETGRAMETIRLLLQRHEPDVLASPIEGAVAVSELSTEQAVIAAARGGESTERIAARMGVPESFVSDILRQARVAELLRTPIQHIYSAEYDDPNAEERLFAPPGADGKEMALYERTQPRVPPSLPPYLQDLYRLPLLTPEGERRLFHQYNFLRYRAELARRRLAAAGGALTDLTEVEELLKRADAIKSSLVQANLRLVISIAKRHLRPGRGPTLFELVSDGNLALFRAVEKFEVARGFKFSTYATWAIVRLFARAIPDEVRWEHRHQTGREDVLLSAGNAAAEPVDNHEPGDLRQALAGGLQHLDTRERVIIERHFGIRPAGEGRPLEEIGRELGISKERARQLKERALAKLREQLAGTLTL